MSSDPFQESFLDKAKRASQASSVNAAANALFGPTVDKNSKYFQSLKEDMKRADMDVLYRTYVSKMFLYSSFTLVLGVVMGGIYSLIQGLPLLIALRYTIGVPLALALILFTVMYVYPSQIVKSRQKSINENLPFAMNHLSAIATSGIPPSSMFELLSNFDEYGGISKEAEKISRRVNAFGEDTTTAIREAAESSPSESWDEILYGVLSTIETGGNLESFLKEKSEEALFEHKMEKEKQIERLSTYASFYTAILIAAPVFLVTILSVMNLLGGQVMGFAIRDLMWMGVHIIIPFINTIFLLFLGLRVN